MKRRERTARGRVGMIRKRRQEVGIWRSRGREKGICGAVTKIC